MSLQSYRQLLVKVDAKFSEIQEKCKDKMICRAGCHSCCQPDLSVFAIEKENIKLFLEKKPDIVGRVRQIASSDPWEKERCKFLNAEGKCLIYECRPITCRSHGAPIRFKVDDVPQNDVCPLNFQDFNLKELPDTLLFNLDTVNTLLSLVNRQFSEEDSEKRYRLDLDEIF